MKIKSAHTSKNNLTKLLASKDNLVGDFDEIKKVTLCEECNEELFDIDCRCTDYGESMDFFN